MAKKDEHLHPRPLAERLIARDLERGRERPALFTRKCERMRVSPLAFLRGSASLFYEVLKLEPDLMDGPAGEGWLIGDLHIENFGAYEPGPWIGPKEQRPAHFDINDFDEGFIGPFRIDLLRLVTSLLVGSRELGTTGGESIELARRLLASYVDALFRDAPRGELPLPVRELSGRASRRSHRELAKRYVEPGERRLRRSTKLLPLDAATTEGVENAFRGYRRSIDDRIKKSHAELVDCAFRVAGTGSIGVFRVIALVAGREHPWLFDMKEETEPSSRELFAGEAVDHALRVLTACRSAVDAPALIGTTTMGSRSLLVRRLTEEEDKLDLTALRTHDLPPLASHLGWLVGKAHARGATKTPRARWTAGDLEHLLDSAVQLAGIHEAAYLAFCRLSSDSGR